MSATTMLKATKTNDLWQTPLYAVKPIVPYLKPKSKILCPFDNLYSAYVYVLRAAWHKVTYGHTDIGKDFFDVTQKQAEKFDYIISNPPYSIKDAVFKHLFLLDRPFAMLMACNGIFEGERYNLFKYKNIQIMVLRPRVAFLDSDGIPQKSPCFQSWYICYGLNLPKDIMFTELEK